MKTVATIYDIPRDFAAAVMQADGTWLVYMPGDELPPAPPAADPVPGSITKRQLYRGLMQVGWLGATMPQIEAAVNGMLSQMPDPPRETARTEFYTSRDFLRANPLLVAAFKSPPLSKTDAQIDEFFRLCASFAPEAS